MILHYNTEKLKFMHSKQIILKNHQMLAKLSNNIILEFAKIARKKHYLCHPINLISQIFG